MYKADLDVPGPEAYNISDKLVSESAPVLSFGEAAPKEHDDKLPGPGAYDPKDQKISTKGVIIAGKLETKYETESPGPAVYNTRS